MPITRRVIQARPSVPEQLDDTPISVPVNMEKPLPLREEMRRYVRELMVNQADDNSPGTFEEESDFEEELGDDQVMLSQAEMHFVEKQGVPPLDDDEAGDEPAADQRADSAPPSGSAEAAG